MCLNGFRRSSIIGFNVLYFNEEFRSEVGNCGSMFLNCFAFIEFPSILSFVFCIFAVFNRCHFASIGRCQNTKASNLSSNSIQHKNCRNMRRTQNCSSWGKQETTISTFKSWNACVE